MHFLKRKYINTCPYPLSVEYIRCSYHIDWKQIKVVSPLSVQALRFTKFSHRGAALPEPSFFLTRWRGRHTGRGAGKKRFSPRQTCQSPGYSFQRFDANSNSKQMSLLVFPNRRRPLCFFLHARISVASSSGHQTAEMGAVTLHSALGNPTFTAASQRTAKGRPSLRQISKYCHLR